MDEIALGLNCEHCYLAKHSDSVVVVRSKTGAEHGHDEVMPIPVSGKLVGDCRLPQCIFEARTTSVCSIAGKEALRQ